MKYQETKSQEPNKIQIRK